MTTGQDRSAGKLYTYGHIPIVAGSSCWPCLDEQVLAHPTGHLEPFFIAALMGGAMLFIGGTMYF